MNLSSKFLTFVVFLRYPWVPSRYRYYLRFRFISKLKQLRFLYRDYIRKRPYKTVQFAGEFGPELTSAIPYAYWHHCNGTLLKTVGVRGTQPLYFFSKNHEESGDERKWNPNPDTAIPNSEDHVFYLDQRKWKRVPYKKHFQNQKFVFEKPLLVVCNKHNIEWGESPINFISLDDLKWLFSTLQDRFQIVYNRPSNNLIARDNSENVSFGDKVMIRDQFPDTILLEDLAEYDDHDFNELQLSVYANCERFISVQGGNSVLASYFGGTNIIFIKKGLEIYFNAHKNVFPELAGTEIISVSSSDQLRKAIIQHYLD